MSLATEIGRELLASDLKPRTIVVIKPPDPSGRDRQIHMTMWVQSVGDRMVVFHSAVLHWSVITFRTAEDGLVDDQDRPVRIFEYLGEP
jgi:hypothetical protein